ncbi:MAG: Y-family DNA polymerase [Flavobacteriales bacterium]|nr:Y-family DNA polymerase [Flavobacteriales bacterium]MCB9365217.1 Y-family DNA polymerase [Flavobacteriales bacterium]
MYALVDCNNFYASCERVFNPSLKDKPIVVLSNNDGCVIARSNEAKKIGIPMGALAFEYEQLFKRNNVHVFSSNYALYGDMSSRVMDILSSFSPEIEIYSIDEAFLKFDGCNYIDFHSYGKKIHDTTVKSTGIPISIGFAKTKALAKVANKIAKKFSEKTNNVYLIDNDIKRIKALKWLPIEDVWGIGRQLSKKLKHRGVNNAFDFTQLNDTWIKKNLSIVELRLKKDLEGTPTLLLESVTNKKSIATTRSFEKDYTNYNDIKERISTFAVSCAEKLRKQKSNCNALIVFLRTNSNKNLPQYNKNIVVQLPFPTNSSIEISKLAIRGLKHIYKDGYHYKKAGVIVIKITPQNEKQLMIFQNSNPKHEKLMLIIDKLNNEIGQQKIKIASQDLGRTWKMKQEYLSPRYTTKLSEVISIK